MCIQSLLLGRKKVEEIAKAQKIAKPVYLIIWIGIGVILMVYIVLAGIERQRAQSEINDYMKNANIQMQEAKDQMKKAKMEMNQ